MAISPARMQLRGQRGQIARPPTAPIAQQPMAPIAQQPVAQQPVAPIAQQPVAPLPINTQPVGQPMQPQVMPANVPQTGLIGSEQALNQGLQRAMAGLDYGVQQGQAGIQQGLTGGLDQLSQARAQGLGAIDQSIGQGVSGLEQFTGAGVQGQNLQAALAGLQGQAAFNQALMANPATQFLQQQGEQSALRTAAARGGLGGGNVMKELARFNTGLAAQDLQNQFDRAGALTNQGLTAQGQIGQLRGQQAGLSSGLVGDLGRTGAGMYGQAGQQLGDIGMQGGLFAGQAALGTGQNLAQGRTVAGQQIASQIGGTSSALADLINQQGAGISGMTEATSSNLANLLSGAGQVQGGSQRDLAALLANIATGQATGTQTSEAQFLNTEGNADAIGKIAGAIGGAMASDPRLKENVQSIGVSNDGHNLYTWDWTEDAKPIVGDQPGIGVMADELLETLPNAVSMGDDGYLRVDYSLIK